METLITPQTYKRLTKTDMSIARIREMVKAKVLDGIITDGGHYLIWYKGEIENEN